MPRDRCLQPANRRPKALRGRAEGRPLALRQVTVALGTHVPALSLSPLSLDGPLEAAAGCRQRILPSDGLADYLQMDSDPPALIGRLRRRARCAAQALHPPHPLRGGPASDAREGWALRTQSHCGFVAPLAALRPIPEAMEREIVALAVFSLVIGPLSE